MAKGHVQVQLDFHLFDYGDLSLVVAENVDVLQFVIVDAFSFPVRVRAVDVSPDTQGFFILASSVRVVLYYKISYLCRLVKLTSFAKALPASDFRMSYTKTFWSNL